MSSRTAIINTVKPTKSLSLIVQFVYSHIGLYFQSIIPSKLIHKG